MRFGQIMIVNFPMPHALHKNNRTSRAVRSGFFGSLRKVVGRRKQIRIYRSKPNEQILQGSRFGSRNKGTKRTVFPCSETARMIAPTPFLLFYFLIVISEKC